MKKKYEIRCLSHARNVNCPRWVKVEGDYHKIIDGNLHVYDDDYKLVLVIQNGEWLEMSVSKIPEEPIEDTIERLTPLVSDADLVGIQGAIDIEAELFHAELKHVGLFETFQKSARALADGTGDGEVASVIIKMINQKWKDRGDVDDLIDIRKLGVHDPY